LTGRHENVYRTENLDNLTGSFCIYNRGSIDGILYVLFVLLIQDGYKGIKTGRDILPYTPTKENGYKRQI